MVSSHSAALQLGGETADAAETASAPPQMLLPDDAAEVVLTAAAYVAKLAPQLPCCLPVRCPTTITPMFGHGVRAARCRGAPTAVMA